MASLDSLPPDQRAVLQLVLQRGRTYDDIAQLLSIDRAAVRQRALDAFDSIGPTTSVAAPQRALVTDYLLAQLPAKIAEQVHERLAASPPERAWARVIASELSTMASAPLPEIPAAASRAATAPPAAPPSGRSPTPAGDDADRAPRDREPRGERAERRPRRESARPSSEAPLAAAGRSTSPGGSRRGGAVLLGVLAAAIVVALVLIFALGGSSRPHHSAATASTPRTTPTTSTPGSTATSTTPGSAKIINQINLKPAAAGSKATGVVFVVRENSTVGVVIKATHVPANSRNAYAVWLSNPGGASERVGFVGQEVGSSGVLQTQGALPPDATKYKELLVTLETQKSPKTPGTVVLQGPFSETR
jgi:hypothetical protein